MNIHIPQRVRCLVAVAPAVALGAAAILVDTASAASDPCFEPTLEIFSTEVPGASSSEGKASVKTKCKKPFIIEASGTAEGFLDQDSGAVGSISAAGASRFYTKTCSGWSYAWSAKGTVAGVLRAKASKTTCGSAQAACSFAGTVAGDINPQAHDSKTASNSTAGGTSISLSTGAADTGPSYGLGMNISPQTVTASSNPAGDSNSILGGPKCNQGAGPETICTVNLYGYVTVQALGGGCLGPLDPHVSKSTASAGGYVGGVVEQELYARSPDGQMLGMGIHAQTGFWRVLKWNPVTNKWDHGGWLPNFGKRFEEEGPKEGVSDEPFSPPSPTDREPNDGDWRRK